MKNLAALLAGTVFGAGLVISGMTDPNKVLFLLIAEFRTNSRLPTLTNDWTGVNHLQWQQSAPQDAGAIHTKQRRQQKPT